MKKLLRKAIRLNWLNPNGWNDGWIMTFLGDGVKNRLEVLDTPGTKTPPVVMPFPFGAENPYTIWASALPGYPSPSAAAMAATTMNRFTIAPLVSNLPSQAL